MFYTHPGGKFFKELFLRRKCGNLVFSKIKIIDRTLDKCLVNLVFSKITIIDEMNNKERSSNLVFSKLIM